MTTQHFKSAARRLALAAVAALALGAVPAASAVMPEVGQGQIDAMDAGRNVIVIDDRQYAAGTNLQIHGSRGSGKSALGKGMQVEFQYVMKNGERVLTDIWLPGARK
ncbi:MAG TPA: hypothetical protein VGA00_08065 [Acidiferrobacterales bacterium]|jgi:predicted AAA+ superfamily ATPase